MNTSRALLFLLLVAGFHSVSCTSNRKRATAGSPAILDTLIATPVSEETIARLKAIADSPNASLPGERDTLTEDPAPPEEDSAVLASTSPDRTSTGFEAPSSWRGPGLNPDEVNPGDIFSEKEGPVLRKGFSLLDELPASERNPLLTQFTSSRTERVPVTISRTELSELSAGIEEGIPLPTRSVALDFRTETHTLDPERHAALLDRISRGESAGAIASSDRLARLRKQLETVKKQLRSGAALYVVTSVAESSLVHATYPGAPVGKRDAEPVRNAVQALYPHLRKLEAEKGDESIRISGTPRILWEFETRELSLEGERLVIGGKAAPGL